MRRLKSIRRPVRKTPDPEAGPLLPAASTYAAARHAAAQASNGELGKVRDLLTHEPKTLQNDGLADAIQLELDDRFRARLGTGPLSKQEIQAWSEWLGDAEFVQRHISRWFKSAPPLVIPKPSPSRPA